MAPRLAPQRTTRTTSGVAPPSFDVSWRSAASVASAVSGFVDFATPMRTLAAAFARPCDDVACAICGRSTARPSEMARRTLSRSLSFDSER